MKEQKFTKSHIQWSVKGNRKWRKSFLANSALFIWGGVMSISGLIIQFHYHLLANADGSTVWLINRGEWNLVHVLSAAIFLVVVVYHLWLHRKWYESVLKRNLLAKHRPTLTLTFLVFVVTITGLIPLLINYCDGNQAFRVLIVEIHDKIAILFFVIIVFHTRKRFKWYVNVVKSKL